GSSDRGALPVLDALAAEVDQVAIGAHFDTVPSAVDGHRDLVVVEGVVDLGHLHQHAHLRRGSHLGFQAALDGAAVAPAGKAADHTEKLVVDYGPALRAGQG